MDSTHLYTQRGKTPDEIMRNDDFWVTPSLGTEAVERQDAPRANIIPWRLFGSVLAFLFIAWGIAAIAEPAFDAVLRNAVHIDCMGVAGC